MSSRKTSLRVTALIALGAVLSGCAQWHCNALPDREQCYAAYDQYETCQYQSRPLIRQVGETWRSECRTERVACGKRDRRCIERVREVCRSYPEPIYDYRSACAARAWQPMTCISTGRRFENLKSSCPRRRASRQAVGLGSRFRGNDDFVFYCRFNRLNHGSSRSMASSMIAASMQKEKRM
jgi:hypothetical protein